MKKAQAKKGLVVNEIKDKILGCEATVLTDYRGLTVQDMNVLRSRCRENKVEYYVVKNTLTALAIKETELQDLHSYLVGPTAIGLSHSDPVALAKVLTEFAKEYEAFEIKAGALNGKVLGPDGIKELASLPPREVLIAQMLAQMKSPIAGLLNTLSAPLRGLMNVLKAIEEQSAEGREQKAEGKEQDTAKEEKAESREQKTDEKVNGDQ